jgi:hypothetical protein
LTRLLGKWDLYRSYEEARGQRGQEANPVDET